MCHRAVFLAKNTRFIDLDPPLDLSDFVKVRATDEGTSSVECDSNVEIPDFGVKIGSKIEIFSNFFWAVFKAIHAQKSTFQEAEKTLINKGFRRFL